VIRAAIDEEHAEHDEAIGEPGNRAVSADDRGLKWRRAARSPEIRQHRIRAHPDQDFDISAEINALTDGRADIGAVVSFHRAVP
jgi:hypothetical protein